MNTDIVFLLQYYPLVNIYMKNTRTNISRFGTRLHFELMVITKVDTINDNEVTTGRTISKQSPCVIYSAPVACIVCQEIEVTPVSKQNPNVLATSDFLLAISSTSLCFNKMPMDNLSNTESSTLLLWL